MLRVGLTGGIGSGKSTVADMFARHRVPVIDTDIIARDVVGTGEPALEQITREFGKDVLDAQGKLDRAQLRMRVFDNPDARRRLETILHPRIRAAVLNQLSALHAPYCLVVVPLLVETGFRELIDRVLVVDADEAKQLERTAARDGVSMEAARKILAAQAKREERLAQADDVILNNGTLEHLAREVERLHAQYLALSKRY
jgi:dephospho-CoA kinase